MWTRAERWTAVGAIATICSVLVTIFFGVTSPDKVNHLGGIGGSTPANVPATKVELNRSNDGKAATPGSGEAKLNSATADENNSATNKDGPDNKFGSAVLQKEGAGLARTERPGEESQRKSSEPSRENDTAKPQVQHGVVVVVDGGQIVLNVGSGTGLKVGDQLDVERETKNITDPATGRVLRRLTAPVGVVKVIDIDEATAVCTQLSGIVVKAGDVVRTRR